VHLQELRVSVFAEEGGMMLKILGYLMYPAAFVMTAVVETIRDFLWGLLLIAWEG
jgi:hypothetical protein